MKLTFIRHYKSITAFPEIELPDFIVLTGVNGAGKSHLLEAVEGRAVRINNIELDDKTRPIRRFDWTNLVPKDNGTFSLYEIAHEKNTLWNEIFQYVQESRGQFFEWIKQQWNRLDTYNLSIHSLLKMTIDDFISEGKTPQEATQIVDSIKSVALSINQVVVDRFVQSNSPNRQNDPYNRRRLIESLEDNAKIPLIAFEKDDFEQNFPEKWLSVDIFQQSFGRLFTDYQRNWQKNQLKYIRSSQGDAISFLTESEFLEMYGEPPWDFLNSVLETANLDFSINKPDKYEDDLYEPILTDKIRGTQIKFADLSSGERVLMSFALCLYNAHDHNQLVDYPKVLLFDEIDAPLHPSMTQSLLRTIQEVLVKRHGIKVILTTHSPSTVALSEEESLYVMYKTGIDRLQKTTKDKALAILTTGVPTISIDYENRRQVFVESQYDVQIYEKIYEKVKNHLIPEISLNFISSGISGHGNCSQVKDIVNCLYSGGNKTVYGIVDWDSSYNGNERVKVLGRGSRYSIENYIFDPLLLAAFLLREKWIERPTIGLNCHETYIHLAEFDNARLQLVADFIVNKVRVHSSSQPEENKISCEYFGGQIIDLPSWFLTIQGDQLEQTLKEIFQKLKRFQKESQLKQEIITKVVDDIPALIPKDFISLFQEIQNKINPE
jgi:ABC-type branched-subunit amino acid transport system ATPase component